MTIDTTTSPDIDSLVRDYYIDTSPHFIYDGDDETKERQEWRNEDDDGYSSSFSYRYCDICRLDRADWLKYYCYSNKGLNRQLITICMKCLDKYNHKEYERKLQRLERLVTENNACLNNGNGRRTVTIGGVIDIKTADNAKDQIMLLLACSLAINSKSRKKNSIIATNTTAYNFGFDDVNDVDEDYLFYSAVRMAYDQSEDVRKYFCNNPFRISFKNKRLWPLRYQAYKEYGI
jgi:hypothetical protein